MPLADYHRRAAVAASQVIAGFDEQLFEAALESTGIGLALGRDAANTREGRALADLTVRLLARLYPTLALVSGPGAEALCTELSTLARAVNPKITITDHAAVGIAIGLDAPAFERTFHAGSDAWTALLSSRAPQPVGDSAIPFGAGAAACFAAAAIFRSVLMGEPDPVPDDLTVSCLDGIDPIAPKVPENGWALPGSTVLVGCGAVGQAAVWALGRSPLRGDLDLVDHESVELSNIQRYVLTTRADENAGKAELTAATPTVGLTFHSHPEEWASFTAAHGYRWETALVAVDSAAARRAVQASLPRWIANAWTQPGDLGVSTHAFLTGACLSCLYLPTGQTPSEDAVVASALGVDQLVREVRTLLHSRAPMPPDVLDAIATGLDVPRDALARFEGRPIRELYVEGVCGGSVIQLGQAGRPRQDVHVPLAHQSALAGVLLAARLVRRAAGIEPGGTQITGFDILRSPAAHPTRPALKDPRGTCVCQDSDYLHVYRVKWPTEPAS
ncbi:E2 ligase fold family C protein [Saccharothrix variisporea]|uniref:ThiF family protein n=1 Tax=Saccharothrix variisporea TaxID=543527 RepID=A0A495XJ46_9PSEU|nr:E2 ligase fold family C protein [Saccharothrix variisporea]RKT74400.1 ThiF family protein [Saccharothrix variisporea]